MCSLESIDDTHETSGTGNSRRDRKSKRMHNKYERDKLHIRLKRTGHLVIKGV